MSGGYSGSTPYLMLLLKGNFYEKNKTFFVLLGLPIVLIIIFPFASSFLKFENTAQNAINAIICGLLCAELILILGLIIIAFNLIIKNGKAFAYYVTRLVF